MKTLFIAPHNDDETLFGSAAIMRTQADVLIVYDSFIQVARGAPGCSAGVRRHETEVACRILGAGLVRFAGLRDSEDYTVDQVAAAIRIAMGPPGIYTTLFAPGSAACGHLQHNLVADAVEHLGMKIGVHRYATYTRTAGKTVTGAPMRLNAEETKRKLRALVCYESQIDLDNCRPHFQRDLEEYLL